jgi:hypothetical protein
MVRRRNSRWCAGATPVPSYSLYISRYPLPMDRLDPFDPENLRLDGATAKGAPTPAGKSLKPPRHRPGEWFLRGPIPWPWLEAAARLPGKALALSLCLWREAGRQHQRTVHLCLSRIGMGVGRHSAGRALRFLEAAGLLSVLRQSGRGLEVTLLEMSEQKSCSGERRKRNR